MTARTIVSHVRRRFIGDDGGKRREYALNRRDTTPVYQGEGDAQRCPYCRQGQVHSTALHEHAVQAGSVNHDG